MRILLMHDNVLNCFQMLIEKFEEFKQDTTNIGNERLAKTNEVCDQLIGTGHSDAATIAQHKDAVNEAWSNLLELMNTRIQVLHVLLFEYISFQMVVYSKRFCFP